MFPPGGWVKNLAEDFINMSEKFIKLNREEPGIAVLTISRPEALNALNKEVLMELRSNLDSLFVDTTVRVIVLRGDGDKAFVAGGDILEMQSLDRGQATEFSRLGHGICNSLELAPKVTIAAVHGFALGGGTELALACDFILASEKAVFGLPEVSLGVIPGFGGTLRLGRIVGTAKAKEIIFTGSKIKAEDAKQMGLIAQVYPQETFFQEVLKVAKKISGNSLEAILSAKKLLNEFEESIGLYQKCDAETHQFGSMFGGFDQKEGMAAFAEKRAAKFKGL